MDNQASKVIKQYLTLKQFDSMLVKPHNHRVNAAKRAIKTFNNHLLVRSLHQIANSLNSFGTNFPYKLKILLTYFACRVSIQLCQHKRPCIAPTIGTDFPWHLQAVKPSYIMNPPKHVPHGVVAATMLGMLDNSLAITNTITIFCPKQGHTVSLALQNCSHSTGRYHFCCEISICRRL